MSIKDWPEGERPREKLQALGVAALSDAELLAILLRVGTRGMSAVDLARYLITEFGSLSQLMSANERELMKHKGMGLASYTQFAVVKEIGQRILVAELCEQTVFNAPDQVKQFLRLQLGSEKVEVTLALLLNRQNQLLCIRELARGTLAENTVYIREVVKLALDEHASALIIAHNHPNGDLIPSDEDIKATSDLFRTLKPVGIMLLDHIIVAGGQAISLKESGAFTLLK